MGADVADGSCSRGCDEEDIVAPSAVGGGGAGPESRVRPGGGGTPGCRRSREVDRKSQPCLGRDPQAGPAPLSPHHPGPGLLQPPQQPARVGYRAWVPAPSWEGGAWQQAVAPPLREGAAARPLHGVGTQSAQEGGGHPEGGPSPARPGPASPVKGPPPPRGNLLRPTPDQVPPALWGQPWAAAPVGRCSSCSRLPSPRLSPCPAR